jgi:nucleotide-binding universal stress UspA family protein
LSDDRIVVAVDGSEASAKALAFARDIALETGLGIEGVFVLDSQWPDFIGNDWQSAKGARQGFLDYIREEQEAQAKLAEAQFSLAAHGLNGQATFKTVPGDPAEILCGLAANANIYALVFGEKVFQVSGRPSLKALVKTVLKKATRPVMVVD